MPELPKIYDFPNARHIDRGNLNSNFAAFDLFRRTVSRKLGTGEIFSPTQYGFFPIVVVAPVSQGLAYSDGRRFYAKLATTKSGLLSSNAWLGIANPLPGLDGIFTVTNPLAPPDGGPIPPYGTILWARQINYQEASGSFITFVLADYEPLFAAIVATGPNGEADLTGAEYWIQFVDPDTTIVSGGTTKWTLRTPITKTIKPAVNLIEARIDGTGTPTHTLLNDGSKVVPVQYLTVPDPNHAGQNLSLYMFEKQGPALQVVVLAKTSGVNYDAGTQLATWVYTASIGSASVGSGLSPEFREKGKREQATLGMGTFEGATGAFRLIQAFEQFDPTICT